MKELLPSLFAIVFPVFWCSICFLLAQAGGWRSLASHWAAPPGLSPRKRYLRSGRAGWVNYNGALVTGATREGLYLAALFLFRPGHTPLLVPWGDLSREKKRFWWTYLKSSRGHSLALPSRELNSLLEQAEALGADVAHLVDGN